MEPRESGDPACKDPDCAYRAEIGMGWWRWNDDLVERARRENPTLRATVARSLAALRRLGGVAER